MSRTSFMLAAMMNLIWAYVFMLLDNYKVSEILTFIAIGCCGLVIACKGDKSA